MSESDFKERAELIGQMLDKVYPIPDDADQELREAIDSDRQMLVMRAEWNTMPISELRELASGRRT